MKVSHYRELIAWQRAMDLAVVVYDVTVCFPREEIYALTNQVRRAVVSVASNIAEGQGRGTRSDFARFLRIAMGSLQEVETQLLIAERLGYVKAKELDVAFEVAAETGRVVNGLLASITPTDN